MNFSNDFKQIYWWVILAALTSVCIWRLIAGAFLTFDIYLFVLWFIIVLLPLISEISAFGINVKKDIDQAKSEIKSQLAEIRNSINNNQNLAVNIHTAPANQKEIEQKQKEDIVGDEKIPNKKGRKDVSISHFEGEERKTGTSEKSINRAARIAVIESLVDKYLISKHGENYKPKMKLEDAESGKKLITDGIIFDDNKKISEIIETKCISNRSVLNFFFIASRFIEKLQKLGVRYPVRFILVTDDMDAESANFFEKEINKIGFAGLLGVRLPKIRGSYFKFSDDSIEEIVIK